MTRDTSRWRFETKMVHSGYTPEPTTHAVAVPLYQTVAYSFDSAQHGADLFDLKVAGNIYTRIMNPTNDGAGKARRCVGRRHRRAGTGLGPGRQ